MNLFTLKPITGPLVISGNLKGHFLAGVFLIEVTVSSSSSVALTTREHSVGLCMGLCLLGLFLEL